MNSTGNNHLNIILVLLLTALGLANIFVGNSNKTLLAANQAQVLTTGTFLVAPDKALPRDDQVATRAAALMAQLHCEAALVLDATSKQVLLTKNETTSLYPASTAKIITALVARDLYTLDQVLTIAPGDLTAGNNLGLRVGEQLTVSDLLQALLIVSANEAGTILANHDPAGYPDFVARMNQKAADLGLTQSHFTNPQGYDDPQQKTTAYDLARAGLALLQDPVLAATVATAQTQITSISGRSFNLTNTNQLYFRPNLAYQIRGLKTGTEALAREVLISLLERDRRQILVVVLSADNRYNDTIRLADFVFDNYLWHNQKNSP